LQSLSLQKCDDVEFIIINDGSTLEHCEELSKEYVQLDGRFRYYYQENGGASRARNNGIDKSRGEYIMFVDGDDIISRDCCDYVMRDVVDAKFDCILYRYVRGGADFPQQLVSSRKILTCEEIRMLIFNSLGRTVQNYNNQGIGVGSPWAKIFRKSIIQQLGLSFNTALSRSEDALFCMEFYQNCKSIAIDNHYIYLYVMDNIESLCRKPSDKIVRMLPLICKEFIGFIDRYNMTDKSYRTQIGYLIKEYLVDVEWMYFLRKRGSSICIAKEYYNFLMTPIIHNHLKLLLIDKRLSVKERFAVLLRTTILSFPFMIINKKRLNISSQKVD
jgi:glycosyltransferase involved in cell wall biosynthesis